MMMMMMMVVTGVCEDNIKVNLREIWWEGVDWIHLAQNRDQRRTSVNTVTNLWEP